MYERILVPIDGSELAEQALPYAREIAAKFGSRLTLLRAVTSREEAFRNLVAEPTVATAPEVTADVALNVYESEASGAREYLRRIADGLAGSGIAVETMLAEGSAEHAILTQARENDVSLIVMASHGRGGLGRLVYGSVADAILRDSTIPVLLIRAKD
jgi:nucleotide-binding universal stress UspA family protein